VRCARTVALVAAHDTLMPELPDIVVYLEALDERVTGARLERVRLASPFLLRSVDPPIGSAEGLAVRGVERLGKRVVLALDRDLYLVLHLMIAGRLHWTAAGTAPARAPRRTGRAAERSPSAVGGTIPGGRNGLAAFDFSTGTLVLTEAGSRKRASLHLVRGRDALRALDRGGIDVLAASEAEFREALLSENHTLKRALTDPRLFSGIGNAYSDEILHAARLSPLQLSRHLAGDEIERLHRAVRSVLVMWVERLRAEAGEAFPEKVTAFREGMAVHGRYGRPCPVCGSRVQRIVYAENEADYCARCQTGGRLLADRALSRLLREDWPRRLEDTQDCADQRSRESSHES
jgi:formamidopyrimidine-DNA glycosylase